MATPRKVKPRAAKDERKGGARSKFLEEAKGRKPRAAKDVKPGSLREKSLKRPEKTGVSGTSSEARRIADAKKSRGPFGQLTVRKENMPAKVEEPKRGVVKYEEPKRGVTKYEEPKRGVVKYGGQKPPAGGVVGDALRGTLRGIGSRAALTAGFLLDPSTFDYKGGGKAGEGSDKPTGPLMKGGKLPGYTYLPDKKEDRRPRGRIESGGGPEKRQGDSAPSMARPPKPKARPAAPAAKKEVKTFAKKVEAPAKAAPKKPTFSGNWVNAAPTAMQARAGKKVSGRRTFGRDR